MTVLAKQSPTAYYVYSGNELDNYWLKFLYEIANATNPAAVISFNTYEYEEDISYRFGRLFNLETMRLGIGGVTLLASSGVDGGK